MAHKAFGLNELREMFLSYFESKGHLRLPSFSLIPQNDKSLLLINSGMAPMKPYFTGEQEPPRHRVCTCQKCIRTGDIENIGKTARHGTYFEMLGNFSFGDYFKKEAIPFAWEFLTSPEWVGLEKDRLWPSVFAGNETTPADDEAYNIWTKVVGVSEDHMVRLGKEDNFWEHGSGPCGPCSEIYYDRGAEYGCGKPDCKPGCDCDRYMEIWNVVFSQFNNDGNGNYTELIQKNIDTGMGLERLACVCQNVDSLFDVDTVMNITHKVTELTGASYGKSHKADVSLRVITDHIRSAVFMISDGVLPSNTGRGYVLRRLLRRAARHGRLLGVNGVFLSEIVDTVVHENECHYPELREKQEHITRAIRTEEENFARTLDAGLRIYENLMAEHKAKGEKIFSGADAFKLYDTYGFPIDLTIEMAADEGMQVDEESFKVLMEEQRQRAREAMGDNKDAWKGIDLGLDATPTQFVGYDENSCVSQILALVTEGEVTGVLSEGFEGIMVLDQTPFYAEMGGQTADHGTISAGGSIFEVVNVTKNKGGKFLHYGHVISGSFETGMSVSAKIDAERRMALRRAHSATHLLQAALRKVLGDHVHQAGSLVEPDRLRFDFTHFSAMTPEEISRVNVLTGDYIFDSYDVSTVEMGIDDAKKMGATALFGEKYGNVVRVVRMGDVSMELCGGTHVSNTAMVGPFRIVSESSVASGVRRVEAICGKAFMDYNRDLVSAVNMAAAKFKTTPKDLLERIDGVVGDMKQKDDKIEHLRQKLRLSDISNFGAQYKTVGDMHITLTTRDNFPAEEFRTLGDLLRDRDPNSVAVFAAVNGGRITFVASCGKGAVAAGIKAGDLIKMVSAACGGKGGGKPDSAMGGGSDVLALDDALAKVDDFVAAKLGIVG